VRHGTAHRDAAFSFYTLEGMCTVFVEEKIYVGSTARSRGPGQGRSNHGRV